MMLNKNFNRSLFLFCLVGFTYHLILLVLIVTDDNFRHGIVVDFDSVKISYQLIALNMIPYIVAFIVSLIIFFLSKMKNRYLIFALYLFASLLYFTINEISIYIFSGFYYLRVLGFLCIYFSILFLFFTKKKWIFIQ